jgi:hypothetical protein
MEMKVNLPEGSVQGDAPVISLREVIGEGAAVKRIESRWEPDGGILTTRLQGRVTVEEVKGWAALLAEAIGRIPDDTPFKLLVDLCEYEPAELEAHKAMRMVIPLTLAQHGLRTALLDLFEPVALPLQTVRGVRCTAVAHVHHDESKMGEYERRLGRAKERFFTDAAEAEEWLATAG